MPPKKFIPYSKSTGPKKPRARKAKSEGQRTAIKARQASEDARVDAIAKQRQRSYALRENPQDFLTGMSELTQAYANTGMAKVNATLASDKANEIAEIAPAPPAPALPPGVAIKKKNPSKKIREHNKEVRRKPWDPLNVSHPYHNPLTAEIDIEGVGPTRQTFGTFTQDKPGYKKLSWGPKHRPMGNQVQSGMLPDTDPNNPFAPPQKPNEPAFSKEAIQLGMTLGGELMPAEWAKGEFPAEDLSGVDIEDTEMYKEGAEAREMYGGAGIYHAGGFTPEGVIQGPRESKEKVDKYLDETGPRGKPMGISTRTFYGGYDSMLHGVPGRDFEVDRDRGYRGPGAHGLGALAVVRQFEGQATPPLPVPEVPEEKQEERVERQKITSEQMKALKRKGKELTIQLKKSKDEKEKYFLKQQLDELKYGIDSEKMKGRRRKEEEKGQEEAPISFGATTIEASAVKQYPGPANIQSQMGLFVPLPGSSERYVKGGGEEKVVSTEVSRKELTQEQRQRALLDYKANRGGGMTGGTEEYSAQMSNYVAPEITKLKQRDLSEVEQWGITEQGGRSQTGDIATTAGLDEDFDWQQADLIGLPKKLSAEDIVALKLAKQWGQLGREADVARGWTAYAGGQLKEGSMKDAMDGGDVVPALVDELGIEPELKQSGMSAQALATRRARRIRLGFPEFDEPELIPTADISQRERWHYDKVPVGSTTTGAYSGKAKKNYAVIDNRKPQETLAQQRARKKRRALKDK